MQAKLFIFLTFGFNLLLGGFPMYAPSASTCEPIRVNACKNVGWNHTVRMSTIYPNRYTSIENQESSEAELSHYNRLLLTKCSKNLETFLCSVYFPFCSDKVKQPITACRNLCEEVHLSCVQYFEKLSYEWPKVLSCSHFPEENTETNMCLSGGVTEDITSTSETFTDKKTSLSLATTKPTEPEIIVSRKTSVTNIQSGRTLCRVLYTRNHKNYVYIEKLQSCALRCMSDGIFALSDKQQAEKWVSALACICVVFSSISLFVVVFNYERTLYPERAVVFITVCYLFYGLGYLIRIFYGREAVTCHEEMGTRYMLIDGSGNISCAATFLLSYCFFIAQSIWWLVLCVTWFLSAGLGWNTTAIKSKAAYFHFVSWGIPCGITIVILVLRKIDVNELTGVCSTGNRHENLSALRAFLIGPIFTFLAMGFIFVISGFLAMLRILGDTKTTIIQQLKYKRSITPIILYAAIHMFFLTFILATYFYEYFNKTIWYQNPRLPGPNTIVFLSRIITDFFIGISSSLCLLSIHARPMFDKLKLKLLKKEIALMGKSEHSAIHPLTSNNGTNETSI